MSIQSCSEAAKQLPVTLTPEEEEEAGHVIPNLTEPKTRGHAQKHACLLHVQQTVNHHIWLSDNPVLHDHQLHSKGEQEESMH